MRNPLYVGSNPAFDVYVGVAESLGGGLNIQYTLYTMFFLKKIHPPCTSKKCILTPLPSSFITIFQRRKFEHLGLAMRVPPPPTAFNIN